MSRLFALLLLLPLAACLLPDAYDAEVTIHADGRYAARFDGEVVFVPALRELKGQPDAAIAAAFAEAVAPIHGVVGSEPRGNGVWHLVLEQSGTLQPGGNALPGPDRFLILNRKDGETIIGTPDLSPAHRRQLSGFGRSAGRLCIRSAAPVLSHNADRAPEQPGGCHRWDLDILAGKRVDMRLGL